MSKFYSTISKLGKKERAQVLLDLTSLDIVILARAEKGADYFEILNASRPYKNRLGAKIFASSRKVKVHLQSLKEKGLLEIG